MGREAYCLWCNHRKTDHDGSNRARQRMRFGEHIRWTVTACSSVHDMDGSPCKCRKYEVR